MQRILIASRIMAGDLEWFRKQLGVEPYMKAEVAETQPQWAHLAVTPECAWELPPYADGSQVVLGEEPTDPHLRHFAFPRRAVRLSYDEPELEVEGLTLEMLA